MNDDEFEIVVSIFADVAFIDRTDEPTEAERIQVEAVVRLALKPWMG